ncbi:MAG: sugar phosphate nucleotidyltransferase [Actinomycetota bacterium]
MTDGLAGVVLAAGMGTRLRPLTLLRPKPLCPVADVPLVDLAIQRLVAVAPDIAVNVHHGRAAMEEHLSGRVHISLEEEMPLGTAGALGHMRGWLDGRDALVVNADAWCPGGLQPLIDGWDRATVRLFLVGASRLAPTSKIAGALMPWAAVASLQEEPAGLYERVWARAQAEGWLDVVRYDGPFVDCGTPSQYLEANLLANGGCSVVGDGAVVAGKLDRCVVWGSGVVRPGESLVCAIRPTELITVLVR